jgi:pimeloyl-ACP methyl ester carboxylesterase
MSSQNSTNVRLQVPPWVRHGMRGLLALSPPLATHLAARVLSRPKRYPTPARERTLREDARPRRLAWNDDGGRLVGYAWGAGPPVLLVHGWAGRATQLGSFIGPLVAAGYSVIAYDLPAHGRSNGERTHIIDFRNALIAIGKRHGAFAGVIAHSMGGAAVTMAIAEGLETERLVLISSPSSLLEQTRRFAATLGVSDTLYARMTARIEDYLGTSIDEIDVGAFGQRVQAQTLVVQDDDDDEVLCEAGARIAQTLPRARLLRTKGFGHRRILRAPTVVAAVCEFLTGNAQAGEAASLELLLERELFDRNARV